MILRISLITLGMGLALSGCAGSKIARQPIWVSGSINGLQQSQCNCGGVENKKEFEKRRKAQAKAQAMKNESENR